MNFMNLIYRYYHFCYKTDFSIAKSQGPQTYFQVFSPEYSMNILCKYEPQNIGAFFYLFGFKKIIFECNSMGNGPVDGTITSILRHLKGYYSEMHLFFYLIFAENVTLLSLNIMKLIPLDTSTSKYN